MLSLRVRRPRIVRFVLLLIQILCFVTLIPCNSLTQPVYFPFGTQNPSSEIRRLQEDQARTALVFTCFNCAQMHVAVLAAALLFVVVAGLKEMTGTARWRSAW